MIRWLRRRRRLNTAMDRLTAVTRESTATTYALAAQMGGLIEQLGVTTHE